MIQAFKKISFLVIAFLLAGNIQAQDNRTLETKVADILAQFPTKSNQHSDELSQKIIDLGPYGIAQFLDQLIPLGTGNDTQTRYAIESLARFAARPDHEADRALVEKSILVAVSSETDNEVKSFLIRRLNYCGSDTSVEVLGGLIADNAIASSAIGVLTTIGSEKAGATLLANINNSDLTTQQQIIQALGTIKYKGAIRTLEGQSGSLNLVVQSSALFALAKIASPSSKEILSDAAKAAQFKTDASDAMISYIEYGRNLGISGQKELSRAVCDEIIKNAKSEEQLYIRSAAYSILSDNFGNEITKSLIKEARKTDNGPYLKSLLNYGSNGMTSQNVDDWMKAFKKLSNDGKGQLLNSLAHRSENIILTSGIAPSLESENENLRIEAYKALAIHQKEKASARLIQALKTASSENELDAIKACLMRTLSAKNSNLLTDAFKELGPASKVVALELIGSKRASQHFDLILGLTSDKNPKIQDAAYNALPNIASANNTGALIKLLNASSNPAGIEKVQIALSNIITQGENNAGEQVISAFNSGDSKEKLLPVFPALNSKTGLDIIKEALNNSDNKIKKAAVNALLLWKSEEALPYLYAFISNGNKSKNKVISAYLAKVNSSDFPADQKLLLIRKLVPYSKSTSDLSQIIKAAGSVKTFLSLVFVSDYMDNPEVAQVAMNAVISIVLPRPGEKITLTGDFVREVTQKVIENLTGPDSQYVKIDIREFLEKMPRGKGYESIFNGKDLTGWEGLVKNPIARSKMSKRELEKAQKEANAQMLRDWFVKDGVIGFKGEGYNNICTIKDYGDFEMIVDWKITNGGDSGIYLRGTPQVQIWDIARVNVGAQVGSGGLYNNQKNERIPLTVADNPINDWNTFRIKMIGERVTVYLNGILVTDNVALENYWDRKLPIFSKEAIELQAHGEDLGFRDVYVREISSGDELLSKEEQEAGFKSLFNGRDLDHWIGNKTDYVVENNEIAVRPANGGHGNLFTAEEYSDFNFRFEFKLTPGANNGLGIHAPLKGDAAYMGKELQILDNTAGIYANLKPYQYHASVYGIIAAKRGFLNPVGEWNSQEVIVKGDDIKIILNGTTIVDGNLKEATKNGTADGKNHPGLKKNKGHIGFLGHGSELEFRNIRIKDLTK
jgi:HEAT repeat protein